MCLERTSWQSGAVIHGAVRITSISMAQSHYNMYTHKLVRIMSLPPTELNLFVHVHFQVLLWNAADYQCPLGVSISEYGQEIKDGIICTSIDKANCSCHHVKLRAPYTASAQPALCAETHSSRKRTGRGM